MQIETLKNDNSLLKYELAEAKAELVSMRDMVNNANTLLGESDDQVKRLVRLGQAMALRLLCSHHHDNYATDWVEYLAAENLQPEAESNPCQNKMPGDGQPFRYFWCKLPVGHEGPCEWTQDKPEADNES